MREIRIPRIDWSKVLGHSCNVPVKVDWPELQLTEDQILANAVAFANDEPYPFPDHSMFVIVIPRPPHE